MILLPIITSAPGTPSARKHRVSGLCRLGNPTSVPWVHKKIQNATSACVADSLLGCCYTLAGPPSSVGGPSCFGHNKDCVLLLRTTATLVDERLSQLCVWARLRHTGSAVAPHLGYLGRRPAALQPYHHCDITWKTQAKTLPDLKTRCGPALDGYLRV